MGNKGTIGHPWLTAKQLPRSLRLPTRASLIQHKKNWWFYSPKSFLRLRRLGPLIDEPTTLYAKTPDKILDANLFKVLFFEPLKNHLRLTLNKKIQDLALGEDERCLRWIFSENDMIPGLILDVFENCIVAQINSAPIEVFWFPIKDCIIQAYYEEFRVRPEVIELRNSPIRAKEGLEIIAPEANKHSVLKWNGFLWHMAPASTQKTGAYFDQRDNHRRAASLALQHNYKIAWDLCAYQGGFSLHLLKAGLTVTAVDQSSTALNTAVENVKLNSLPENKFVPEVADVFTWLRNKQSEASSTSADNKVDLIVLDPPSFVKSHKMLKPALRGYQELNELATACLKPGGLLVSCVCSHHITPQAYEKILQSAALQSQRQILSLEMFGPSADHKPATNFPEGHYLQAWFMRLA